MSPTRPSQAFSNAFDALAVEQYDLLPDCDMHHALQDLLTDCRRWADFHGVDFFKALDDSYIPYLEGLD